MRKHLSKYLGKLAALAAVVALGILTCSPALEAGMLFRSVPAGMLARNSGTLGSTGAQETIQRTMPLGWQISGPFTASPQTYTAIVITPRSLATNMKDGLAYQGPVRVFAYCRQTVQVMPTNLTYSPYTADGTTTTANGAGIIYAAGTLIDSNLLGEMWAGSSFAITLSSTATAAPNSVTYWVADQDM